MKQRELPKYLVEFAGQTSEFTDEEFLNFIRTAVINNRDIKSFSAIEINRNIKP